MLNSNFTFLTQLCLIPWLLNKPSLTQVPKPPSPEPMFPNPGKPLANPSKLANEILCKSKQANTTPGNLDTITCLVPPKFVENCWFPSNLLEIITQISTYPGQHMNKPTFSFEMSKEAATTNWKILNSFRDLGEALESQTDSQLSYGSEFRKPILLQHIFKHHPLWPRLKDQLENGVQFPLEDLTTEERKKDLLEGLTFGNHKGVSSDSDLFKEMMSSDVMNGYSLVLPREEIINIPNALMAPMNIHDQYGINEKGEIIAKKRLTHNQSCKFGSNTSLNSRVTKDSLQDCMYGACLSRVIHQIIDLRLRHPNKKILLQKIDWKAAYRRAHLNWKTAIQTITQDVNENLAFLSLRLTFGGAPNPNFWGEISESTTDLANAILQLEDWDPKTLHSPIQHKVPKTETITSNEPLATALPLSIEMDEKDTGKSDVYIDDITTVTVDIGSNKERAEAAVLLAMHIIGRPFNQNDPIKRLDLVSLSKLIAEARLEETKILLGWKLNTRTLKISLPFDKFKAWSNSIEKIIKSQRSTFKELESLIGRLGHTTTINRFAIHFMSRIRQEMGRAKNRRMIKVKQTAIDDLNLHLDFLKLAHNGISMNQISYRKPTHTYRADACPFGLGGYSLKGRAWCFQIPTELRFRATINMLEHLASIVGPWIDLIENNLPPLSCILAMGDSTTAAGWLRKSNFKESESESQQMTEEKIKLSRDHARRLMMNSCCEYSQWFPGVDNDLADSLSRDHHLNPETLTKLFKSQIPKQTPRNLEILPLPQEISSSIMSMLQNLPAATQQPEKLKTSSLAHGLDGTNLSGNSILGKIHFSINTPNDNVPSSSLPLAKLSESEDLHKDMESPWYAAQSRPPWTTYLRPSESLTSPTHATMKEASLTAFYNNSSRAIKMRTRMQNKRKHSL